MTKHTIFDGLELTLCRVRIAELRGSKYNPKLRSKPSPKLVDSIKTAGVIFPILIRQDGFLLDGHRRTAAARAAGLVEIPAFRLPVLSDEQAQTLYTTLNMNAKHLSGADWVEAIVRGLDDTHVSAANAAATARLLRGMLSDKEIIARFDAGNRIGFTLLNYARRATNIYLEYKSVSDKDEVCVRFLDWIFKHKTQNKVNDYLRHRAALNPRTVESLDKQLIKALDKDTDLSKAFLKVWS